MTDSIFATTVTGSCMALAPAGQLLTHTVIQELRKEKTYKIKPRLTLAARFSGEKEAKYTDCEACR